MSYGPNIPDVQLQSAGWVANFRSVRVHHSAAPVKTGVAIVCKLRVDGLRSMARIRRDPAFQLSEPVRTSIHVEAARMEEPWLGRGQQNCQGSNMRYGVPRRRAAKLVLRILLNF